MRLRGARAAVSCAVGFFFLARPFFVRVRRCVRARGVGGLTRTAARDAKRVCSLFPLTGRLRTGGIEREAAARFAVDQINAKKVLLPNHRLRLINFDTFTDEKESTRLALTLCDQYKVLGLIGEAASVNSQAVALIADIYNTAQISYSSTAVALSDKNRYPTFFRTCPSDAFQGAVCVCVCVCVWGGRSSSSSSSCCVLFRGSVGFA